MIIEINVSKKIAKLKDKDVVAVCANSDYVIRFNFDEEWNAYTTKTARFKRNGTYTDVVFTGTDCAMPVIEDTYSVEIGVFAGNLHTTTSAYLPMNKSILCGSGAPVSPVPSVYEQIIALLDVKANRNQGSENAGKFWKVGEDGSLIFATSGGTSVIYMRVSAGYIQYSTDNVTWNNVIAVADLKGDKGDTGATGADGADGHSPVVTASKSGKATTVFVDGTAIATINDGNDGTNGTNGTNGQDGEDGFSPVATVQQTSSGATVTITDKNGTTTANIANGQDGSDGQNGTDGYTPVRGTDYWTAADQAQIVSDVLAALPTWTGGNY